MMAKQAFVIAFNLVAAHYGCTPAEVGAMKESARRDMDNAEVCFAALAKEAREAGCIPLDRSGAVALEVSRQVKAK